MSRLGKSVKFPRPKLQDLSHCLDIDINSSVT